MPLALKDRVRETSNTAGTGTLTLGGAVPGFQSFSVIGNANTTYYAIVDVNSGSWEVGLGTYTASGTTLSRDAVLESSAGGVKVDFTASVKDVFCTYPAEQAVTLDDVQTLTNKTISSPSLTGTPTAPTAAAGTNTTQLATTAHVFAERTNTATLTNKTMTGAVLNGTLGATTPSAVTATTVTASGAVTGINISGTNTGDQSTITGNAGTATALATARTIGMSGVTATATSFNGSANITIPVTAVPTTLLTGVIPDARISGSYTGMVNLTGSGSVDFNKFLGLATDLVTSPSYTWTGDTATGFYRPTTSQIGVTIAGVQRALITATGLTVTGTVDATNLSGTNTGDQTDITGSAATANAGPGGSQLAGLRNLIINGNFGINQRGYVSGAVVGAANTYTLDRWRVVTSGQALTFAASGNGNSVTAPAGGLEQVIEGASIAVGFYVVNWTGAGTCTVNGTARSKDVVFTLSSNNNATVRIFGVVSQFQLEPGTVSTPFERRPIGLELSLCQRYFNTVALFVPVPSSSMPLSAIFPVEMRAVPTVTGGGAGFLGVFTSRTIIFAQQTSQASQTLSFTAEL